MAFKGDLTNISLFDVLQTLNTNRQSGVLVLQREGVTKKLHISPDGVSIFFMRQARPIRLGEIFVRRGRVSQQDVEILLLQQKQEYRPIGELLVQSGKVSQEELHDTLRYHAEDEIYEIFGWESGSFSFFDGDTDEQHTNTPLSEILLDSGGLCLEAARRLDEMERLREVVPTNDSFYLQFRGVEIDRESASPTAIAVFDALVNPMSINELRDFVGMSLFAVLGGVVSLIEGELTRALQPNELEAVGNKSQADGDYERAALLFETAHDMAPHNLQTLQLCVAVLEKLDYRRRLASKLTQLGRALAMEGQHETAIDRLEQSLRLDTSNLDAMAALRDSLAATEDIERAAEISLRIARIHAEDQDLAAAIAACRDGLKAAPRSVPVRYYLAQLLARTDQDVLARAELHELIESAREQKRAFRNRKTREFLNNCYRLLLRIDPGDDFAVQGMRELEKHSAGRIRRRRVAIRGALISASVLIVASLGIALLPRSADSLLEEARELLADGNVGEAHELIGEILANHPDSDEAREARTIKSGLGGGAKERAKKRLDAVRAKIEAEFQADLDLLKNLMKNGDYADALSFLNQFLAKLDPIEKKEASKVRFLQKKMLPELRLDIENFMERLRDAVERDTATLSKAQIAMRSKTGIPRMTIDDFVTSLTQIKQRNWTTLSEELDLGLTEALNTKLIESCRREVDRLRKRLKTVNGTFSALDGVFYRIKGLQLQEKIREAMDAAQTQGRELLGQCEFAKARQFYTRALALARTASRPELREHYKEILGWIVQRDVESEMQRWVLAIDAVTDTLTEIERLKVAGQSDEAFVLMRSLVKTHRLVQFERKYTLPYKVTSTPTGASVYVDGERAGTTPCSISIPVVKPAMIRVEGPGFDAVESTLEITDSELTGLLDVSLAKVQLWEKSLRHAPETHPVIAGKLVLVPTNEASLLALNIENGHKVWEAQSGLLDRIRSAPLADDEYAHFITISGELFSVALETGNIDYRTTLPGEVTRDGVLLDGTVYYATSTSKLVAVRDGKIVYAQQLEASPVSALRYANERLYYGTAEGFVHFHDPKTGKETRRVTSREGSSFFDGVAALDDSVVAAAEDGFLYAFATGKSAKTGDKPIWRHRMNGSLSSRPIVVDQTIYLPGAEGFLWLVDAKGKPAGRIDLRNSVRSQPCTTDGFLYLASGGRIAVYDLKTRRPWWEATFEDDPVAQVVAGTTVVVLITESGRVIAYSPDKR